jgi:chromosome segregation ATPase
VRSLESVTDEFKKLQNDKHHLLDQVRKMESQIEILQVENKQLDIASQVSKREKEELHRDISECRDQLYNEQRKAEINYKT